MRKWCREELRYYFIWKKGSKKTSFQWWPHLSRGLKVESNIQIFYKRRNSCRRKSKCVVILKYVYKFFDILSSRGETLLPIPMIVSRPSDIAYKEHVAEVMVNDFWDEVINGIAAFSLTLLLDHLLWRKPSAMLQRHSNSLVVTFLPFSSGLTYV